MPYNGAGVYSPPGADFPAVTQTVISSTHYNNVINDLATALSLALTRDGQATATANIPFGGFRATNIGITGIAGSVGTPAINVSDSGTGLYRSAVSELAVSVAGTQRGRFDSTGLIVTGVVTVSGLVTASAGISATQLTLTTAVSKIVPGATSLSLRNNADSADNLLITDAGIVTVRSSLITTVIDSGAASSIAFKTNNGSQQFAVAHLAGTIVNNWQATGNITTLAPQLLATGTDTSVPAQIATKGTGTIAFVTDALGTPRTQLQILHGTGANNLTITNGTNPTLGVTAGSLAITPAVVMANTLTISGASLFVGTTPALTGAIGLPNSTGIFFRNQANSSDFFLIRSSTINSVNDIVQAGGNIGLQGTARSGGAAPTTSDIPSGQWAVWRDTGGATTKLYYNNAGAIQSVALT